MTDLRPWNVKKGLMDLEKGGSYPKVQKNGYDWTGYYKRDGYQGPERGFGARMAQPQQQQPLKDQWQKPMVQGMKGLNLRINQKDKRRALGKCYICGEGNHKCEECPLRSSDMKKRCWDCCVLGCERRPNCLSKAVNRAKWYWNGHPIWSEITKHVHVDVRYGGYWSVEQAVEDQKAKEEELKNDNEWSITPPPVMPQRRRKELEEQKKKLEEMDRTVKRLRSERNLWRDDSEKYEKKYKKAKAEIEKERAKVEEANKQLKKEKKEVNLWKEKLKNDGEYWFKESEKWRKKEAALKMAVAEAYHKVRDYKKELEAIRKANDE